MKKLLIFINLILVAILIVLSISNLAKKSQNQLKKLNSQSVQKKTKRKMTNNVTEEKTVVLPTPDEAVKIIVSSDVFNPVRSPLANTRVGRADMTLVGVVDGQAALIKSNVRQQQFNPYLAQAQRMAASMGGNQGQGGRNFTQWSQMSGRNNNGPAQQYVKIGQTMNNGYTLKSVTRSKAVLARGNDRIELDLQVPSKNRTAGKTQQNRLNSTQQFQQAQMFMQSQMIRTMREIQQNSRGNTQQSNRNRR